MPPRSRRALLQVLGSGSAALLAGCQTDESTDTPTDEPAPPTSTTAPGTRTESPVESPTESPAESPTETTPPGVPDCDVAPRPDVAWPMRRGSPARDGYVATRSSREDPVGSGKTPSVAWTADPPGRKRGDMTNYYLPMVAGDYVYALWGFDPGPSQYDHSRIHALDAPTGELQWASDLSVFTAWPVVWGDLVVVSTQREYWTTKVIALDRTDGTREWVRRFDTRVGSITPAGEHLYVTTETSSGEGSVRALAADGSTAWSRKLDVPLSSLPSVVTASDRLYATSESERLLALSLTDGSTHWKREIGDQTTNRYMTLAASDCAVFVAVNDGNIHAVDKEGEPLWTLAGTSFHELATDGGTVYVAGTPRSESGGWVKAVNAETGDVRWTAAGDGGGDSPVVAGESVYAGLGDAVVALDRWDGSERWRVDDGLSQLALADGTLYGVRQDPYDPPGDSIVALW